MKLNIIENNEHIIRLPNKDKIISAFPARELKNSVVILPAFARTSFEALEKTMYSFKPSVLAVLNRFSPSFSAHHHAVF
ncbi:hypothetical protein J6590_000641 [Homalodisca vitripennis]|nr:hypothetical protein J6590_000641 [Homalodisca vitripennis]